jgi:hypothetical protein
MGGTGAVGTGASSAPERTIDHRFCAFCRHIQINPKFFKIRPSPAKPEQSPSKKKGLDFLGFSWRKSAFSTGYHDPQGQKIFLGSIPSQLAFA